MDTQPAGPHNKAAIEVQLSSLCIDTGDNASWTSLARIQGIPCVCTGQTGHH